MEKKKINIIEVGPRDGFQSVRGDFIPTELKNEIIDLLVDAGVKHQICAAPPTLTIWA